MSDDASGGGPTEYDLVLALLPAPVAGGALFAWLSTVALAPAVAAGSLLASLVLGYALFLAPPS